MNPGRCCSDSGHQCPPVLGRETDGSDVGIRMVSDTSLREIGRERRQLARPLYCPLLDDVDFFGKTVSIDVRFSYYSLSVVSRSYSCCCFRKS